MPPPDQPPPPPAPRPAGYVQIGDFELGVGTDARCVVTVKPKSAGKVDKKEADGKNGAATTWKGAKPAEWEIDLAWSVREHIPHEVANDERIEEILFQLSPMGPNPGKSMQFATKRARVHGTENVMVESVDGPDDVPGTSEVKAKIKAASWVKPAATAQAKDQGEAKTDTDPQKWRLNSQQPATSVDGFGGIPGNKVTFPATAPTVKP